MNFELSQRGRVIGMAFAALAVVVVLVVGISVLRTRRDESLNARSVMPRGPRHLDAEAVARIRDRLHQTPGLDIEVGVVAQDAEALALAEELRTVFEGAGFKTRKLVEYSPQPKVPPGVAVYSKHQMDNVIGEAIAQIFTELDQQRVQWLEDDLEPLAKASEPPPELKIFVNRQ